MRLHMPLHMPLHPTHKRQVSSLHSWRRCQQRCRGTRHSRSLEPGDDRSGLQEALMTT